MIKKLTSEQFMNVLEDAQDTITQTKNTVENIQSVLENKINLMTEGECLY